MEWWPDCIPCVLRMAMGVARQVLGDDEKVMALMQEVMRSPHFGGDVGTAGVGRTPRAPEVVRDVWIRLTEITGEADLLRDEKERQNQVVLGLYPELRSHVRGHADPFAAALRLAIMGNALDMMVDTGSERAAGPATLSALVGASEAATVDLRAVDVFKERVTRADSIAYLGDNCGEVVLDRLFIETLQWMRGDAGVASEDSAVGAAAGGDAAPASGPRVVFVTRTVPSGNDVTAAEAEVVGMGEVAGIVPNGILVPLPGTDLRICSPEVRSLVAEADLVVSKGGANFEMLDDLAELEGRVSFLLHGKCRPLCGATGVGPGDLVVANR